MVAPRRSTRSAPTPSTSGRRQDIPPLFAQWTGTDVTIVATTSRVDAINHPVYELGVAPGVDVTSLEDLKGKKIAYSPGQAQGALVLRALDEAGLSQDDVELVEIQSVDDVYVNVLGSKQVDVAPLGGTLLTSYLAKYGQDGGTSIPTGIRDDQSLLYAPVETTEDDGKAAALAKYVVVWAKAKQWINEHPEEYAQAFYVDHEGLTLEDGLALIEQTGQLEVPLDWDETIAAPPGDRGPAREGAGPRRARRGRPLRPPLREGHRRRPRRWRLMTTVLERPDRGRRRSGRRQARRTPPARPGQAHPVLPGHRADPAGRPVVPAVVPPAGSTRARSPSRGWSSRPPGT